jgi:hypothetical protein
MGLTNNYETRKTCGPAFNEALQSFSSEFEKRNHKSLSLSTKIKCPRKQSFTIYTKKTKSTYFQ